ncbi:MAG TPA: hybrid sensor histidine kinase/response regulator [Desulfobacteraceae bacterium]|nr:hybrid sensor histidine kinase/response regulator [Desulfobacteraceae bacterium]
MEKKRRILVVDDNPVNIRLIKTILEKEGYDTVSATDGPAAIETARAESPDLVLMDIFMGEMSGLDACRLIKEEKETGDIPVIFVTANTDDAVLQKAFESGGSDYVRKPINRVELISRIRSVLTQRMLVEKIVEHEKLQVVLEMAGAVCHEMNQPLQAVTWATELLLGEIPEEDHLFTAVRDITRNIEKIGTITRKLQGITRYKTMKYVGDMKIIDIERASSR